MRAGSNTAWKQEVPYRRCFVDGEAFKECYPRCECRLSATQCGACDWTVQVLAARCAFYRFVARGGFLRRWTHNECARTNAKLQVALDGQQRIHPRAHDAIINTTVCKVTGKWSRHISTERTYHQSTSKLDSWDENVSFLDLLIVISMQSRPSLRTCAMSQSFTGIVTNLRRLCCSWYTMSSPSPVSSGSSHHTSVQSPGLFLLNSLGVRRYNGPERLITDG